MTTYAWALIEDGRAIHLGDWREPGPRDPVEEMSIVTFIYGDRAEAQRILDALAAGKRP